MHNCGADTHTFDRLRVDHFVTKHNKMCSLPYAMTANKTYLSTYFPFKPSLFIKRMSLINKVNFKKCFSENYKRMRLTTRVYGILNTIIPLHHGDSFVLPYNAFFSTHQYVCVNKLCHDHITMTFHVR